MSTISLEQRRLLAPGTAFWVVAASFLLMMAFATVPTPLYALYQQRDGFQTFTVTLIFAAYAVGVIVALSFGGHISDWVGRRRMLVIAALIEALSSIIFLLPGAVPTLLVARFVSGLAVGLLTAAATAGLSELRIHHSGHVGIAATVATVANLGGLALGPLIGGIFAEWAPWPLVTPYAVFLAGLIGAAILLTRIPETVTTVPLRASYRRQRVAVPRERRSAFLLAGAAAFAAFAITGFFGSVSPAFLAQIGNVHDHLAVGATAFAVFGAAAIAQLISGRLSPRHQIVAGATTVLLGMTMFAASALTASIALFIVGGVVAGFGVGFLFRSALMTGASLGDAAHRGEVLAGVFLMAYAGMTVPPVLIGLALLWLPMIPVLLVFATATVVLSTAAAAGLARVVRTL
ncbi:MFS transporter [Microbacterium gorillae]|uniref:MFS transporter n=1 Tax=Microbacterium gorillae TaxID=1231063 RepID=UPI003D99B315